MIGSDHPEWPEDPNDGRQRGWLDALEDAGLTTKHLIRVHWSAAGGREAARHLLADHPAATAVFASSDQQAIGLLAGLHAAGRSLPGDVAIVSFDGSPEGEFTVPPLTSVDVPLAAMAAAAIAEVLGVASAGGSYPTRLVVRRSCGCDPA